MKGNFIQSFLSRRISRVTAVLAVVVVFAGYVNLVSRLGSDAAVRAFENDPRNEVWVLGSTPRENKVFNHRLQATGEPALGKEVVKYPITGRKPYHGDKRVALVTGTRGVPEQGKPN